LVKSPCLFDIRTFILAGCGYGVLDAHAYLALGWTRASEGEGSIELISVVAGDFGVLGHQLWMI